MKKEKTISKVGTASPAIPAAASVIPGGGKTTGELVRASNRWRDNYNPLRGLVIGKVIAILEAAERGDFAELQLTMRKIEKRYPVLKGLKSRRLAALEKLDWDIKVPNELPQGATAAQAEAQRKYLRSRYELVGNLTDAIGFLVSAEFRGYAILQKHRIADGSANDGAVGELHWLPQEVFSRNGTFGDFYYNQNSMFGIGLDTCAAVLGEQNRIGSEVLPRDGFVIRENQDPLYEIALIAFVNWAMGRKDWAAFTEIFGLPNGVAIMPANIPPGKEDDYRIAAERVADGISGALPNGSDIKFPTASVRGEAPFKSFCDAQDSDVVLAGTGGRLSMLTAEKGGMGDGPAKQHGDAFDDIAQADARRINSILQQDFDKIELAAEFPGAPALAYFELSAIEEEDASDVADRVQKLEAVGLETDPAEVGEKLGLKLVRGEKPKLQTEDIIPPGPPQPKLITNRRSIHNRADLTPDTSPLAQTLHETILPILKRLEAIAAVDDAGIQQHMVEKLLKDFPQISDAIQSDDSLAKKLSPILADALSAGATNGNT
jgi:phage gp29-like protein